MISAYHQPPIPHVHHVHLYVQDLHRSLYFYERIVGLQGLKQKNNQFQLSANGQTPLLTIESPEGVRAKTKRTTGLYHFAILLPTRKDLAVFFCHLLLNRVPLQGGADHGFSEALYFAEPDGNGIEVYADKPADSWEWQGGQIKGITTELQAEELIRLAEDASFEKMPKDTIIGHLHLHVDDLKKADRFYREGLGLEVVMRYPGQATFYSWGHYHHHIAVNIWNGVNATKPHPLSVGLHQYTIVYYDERERNDTANRLERLGYFVKRDKGGIITEDPAGHLLLLKRDT